MDGSPGTTCLGERACAREVSLTGGVNGGDVFIAARGLMDGFMYP